ncbi:MAG TPA: PA2169 family four-helix-bundle protein [Terracidiphilus sp.]|jgi:uncharacterized protein (TIGR02284 family)
MPSKDQMEAEGILRVVVENLIDAQNNLKSIGEDTKSETLRRWFLAESLKRAEFRGEIEGFLHREGARDIDQDGTASAAVVRAWAGLKAKLGGSDQGLLEIAEEGERSMLTAYADALEMDLPQPVREMLATQAARVRESHQYVAAAVAGAAN